MEIKTKYDLGATAWAQYEPGRFGFGWITLIYVSHYGIHYALSGFENVFEESVIFPNREVAEKWAEENSTLKNQNNGN